MNVLWDGCNSAHQVLDTKTQVKNQYPNRSCQGRKKYISVLAKMVLKMIEEEENQPQGPCGTADIEQFSDSES